MVRVVKHFTVIRVCRKEMGGARIDYGSIIYNASIRVFIISGLA